MSIPKTQAEKVRSFDVYNYHLIIINNLISLGVIIINFVTVYDGLSNEKSQRGKCL